MSNTLHYFVISDSIGDTAMKVTKSVLAQFPNANTVLHKYNFISSKDYLKEILESALTYDALIFMTIVDNELAKMVENYCIETGLICYNLIQPFILEIERRLGIPASAKAGVQHELSDKYFNRIKAIEFCISADDGQDLSLIPEAEIILLGISRTGKTPLSMYLGTLGHKVLNIPIIPESTPPQELFNINPKKIVGLTNNVLTINKQREKRMIEYGMPTQSRYCSKERVTEELAFAIDLYEKLQCHQLNVADLSIEESASIIVDRLNLSIY